VNQATNENTIGMIPWRESERRAAHTMHQQQQQFYMLSEIILLLKVADHIMRISVAL
jgi:hypothetical protein